MQNDAPNSVLIAAKVAVVTLVNFDLGARWAAPVARKRHRPPTVRRECL
jgi:hypothetical protein